MDNNMETTRVSGRQTRPNPKFQHNGSLGAAVGGGGLSSSTPKLLPGFGGSSCHDTTGGAATTNTQQSEGGAYRNRQVAATGAAVGKGKGRAVDSAADQRALQIEAIMNDPQLFSEDSADSSTNLEVGGGNDTEDEHSDESEGDLGGDAEATKGRSGELGGLKGKGSRGRSPSPSGSDVLVLGSAKATQVLKKSIDRNRAKRYVDWPAVLLREACSLRKITGYSKSGNTAKMAELLTSVDKVMERSSPFFMDLDDKVAGGTPASRPPASGKECESVPQGLVDATEAAVKMGASFAAGKLLTHCGKSYPAAVVLAAIEERAQADGGRESTAARRKSKHCVPRLCECMAHPSIRESYAGHRTQLSKQELDAKVTGKTRPVLLDLWEMFKSSEVKVPCTFGDDEHVLAAGIDPNVVHQPDITYDKFIAMKTDLTKDHGDMHVNYKKSGSHGEMYSFCNGSLDTYYYGLMAEKYPEIEQATTQMLPTGTASENTGVGSAASGESGAAGAKSDASRRTAWSQESKERNVGRTGADKKKKQKQEREVEVVTNVAGSVVSQMGLGSLLGASSGSTLVDAPTSFHDTIEGCETRTAKLDLNKRLRDEIKDLKERINAEKALGVDADLEDLELLELDLGRVRSALKKALQADI